MEAFDDPAAARGANSLFALDSLVLTLQPLQPEQSLAEGHLAEGEGPRTSSSSGHLLRPERIDESDDLRAIGFQVKPGSEQAKTREDTQLPLS